MATRKEFEEYLTENPKLAVSPEEERRLLREEVVSAVKEIMDRQDTDKDIGNLLDIFVKKFTSHQKVVFDGRRVEEVENDSWRAERMFWDAVGEGLKENVFKDINKKRIATLIDEGEYQAAEKKIQSELIEAIKRLSPSIYRNKTKLNVALTVLQEKFYGFVPEVKALIYGSMEGKRVKIAAPQGESAEEYLRKAIPRTGRGGKDSVDGEMEKSLQADPPWRVPKLHEIRPDLLIELEGTATEDRHVYLKILIFPYYRGDRAFVRAQRISEYGNPFDAGKEVDLADWGITSDTEGKWRNFYRPTKWGYEEEKMG